MDTITQARGFLVAQGILLIILGIIALLMPGVTTLAVEIIVGFILFFAGLIQAVTALMERHEPGFWWSLLGGLIAGVFGLLLLVYPLQGVLALGVMLTVFYLVTGILWCYAAWLIRSQHGWGWWFFGGLLSIVIAIFIWTQFPISAVWFPGFLVGLNILYFGIASIAYAWASGQVAQQ
jgi:uncharacterized membrane protein HdeD (DUF308 family)